MKVITSDFVQGAKEAKGIAVIIDVFRAFSVACVCLEKRPSQYMAVGAIDDALKLKEQYPDSVLIGEREGKKLPNFDFGNSPTELALANLSNTPIVHTTHAGTQGLVNALQADQILTGSFLNAKATVNYILSQAPTTVTLVRMGWKAETRSDEDDICAEYFERLLKGQDYDIEGMKNRILQSPCSSRFLDPEQPWNPETDLHMCLDFDRIDFAIEAKVNEHGFVELCKR